MADQELNCSDCSNSFVFTDQDQAFYEEKGFSPPKRCKPCREARKQGAGGGQGGGYGGGGQRRQGGGGGGGRSQGGGSRPMFPATCGDCGVKTEVPFEPKSDRPVYCRDCFKARAPR